MNEKLPFEDAFERRMNDMQIPSGDESWQKMSLLLDKQKKRRPLVWFKFYRLWSFAMLIILVSAGTFIYYRSTVKNAVSSRGNNNNTAATTTKSGKTLGNTQTSDVESSLRKDNSNTPTNKKNVAVNTIKNKKRTSVNEYKKGAKAATDIIEKTGATTTSDKNQIIPPGSAITAKSITVNERSKSKQVNEKVLQTKVPSDLARSKVKRRNKLFTGKQTLLLPEVAGMKVNKDLVRSSAEKNAISYYADGIQSKEYSPTLIRRDLETVSITNIPGELKPFPAGAFNTITLRQPIRLSDSIANNIKTAELKKAVSRHGKYFIAAGVGIQQQVPVGGQKPVGYNFNGNKNIITDYMPSVYVRLEKKRHWFLQGEFSYAAPQLVKPFSYRQQTSQNFAAGAYTIHSTVVKKTFYNKAPVSFNYYILPRFSIGAGAVYSWLHSAVAENETITKDVNTQQQTITKQLVAMKGYTDSFLYRSHTYLLLKTNYSVKRFSFGVGFATDLEPYIKYTLPDGTVSQQKNWSLDFSLLFRLYQSRNFSLLSKKGVAQ